MNQATLQDRLFSLVKAKLLPNQSLSDAISEILHVSTDSAYRRIRGETPLVLEELVTLCRHYQFSMDQLVGIGQPNVMFQDIRIHKENFSFEKYLQDLKKQLEALEGFSSKQVIYMSKDLPVFYNFYFRPLASFRYFFWMKIQLQHPEFEKAQFDFDLLPHTIENSSKELLRTYNEIPSTEIWNIESINSTISQIEFSKSSGHFRNQEDIKKVYDALEDTILHLQDQAEHGCKFLPGEDPKLQAPNLRFFSNRVVLGDNTVLTLADNSKTAFINYGNLNYLRTKDEVFCNNLFNDFSNLIRRSTQISATGERQRNIFFNILLSKIRERKLHLA